jgi:hypothetical protein
MVLLLGDAVSGIFDLMWQTTAKTRWGKDTKGVLSVCGRHFDLLVSYLNTGGVTSYTGYLQANQLITAEYRNRAFMVMLNKFSDIETVADTLLLASNLDTFSPNKKDQVKEKHMEDAMMYIFRIPPTSSTTETSTETSTAAEAVTSETSTTTPDKITYQHAVIVVFPKRVASNAVFESVKDITPVVCVLRPNVIRGLTHAKRSDKKIGRWRDIGAGTDPRKHVMVMRASVLKVSSKTPIS